MAPRRKKKPESRRAAELKRRCLDDFNRLKVSFAELLKEVGAMETIRFSNALHVVDSMGLRAPW